MYSLFSFEKSIEASLPSCQTTQRLGLAFLGLLLLLKDMQRLTGHKQIQDHLLYCHWQRHTYGLFGWREKVGGVEGSRVELVFFLKE